MNEKTNIFIQIIRNNVVQITFALMGAMGLALGTYITIRLSPLVEDIHSVAQRVDALEKKGESETPFVLVLNEKVSQIKEDTTEIKQDIKKLIESIR